ncbi:MAG: hypothetical protein HEP70_01170 [Rhodobiaceae bacterium]|nr:hypothetical protein [Rhodobiaceae bacterium]
MEHQDALDAIRSHFATLKPGQTSIQKHTYSRDEVVTYADQFDISYPGVYVTENDKRLVPPAMIFMRPAATFGITSPEAPALARYGIYTKARRKFFHPLEVGQHVLFDGEIVDTFERRGYYYLAVEWIAKTETDMSIATGIEWHTIGFVRAS